MICSARPIKAHSLINDFFINFLQYVNLFFSTATFELLVQKIGHLTALIPSANYFLPRKGLFNLKLVYPFKDIIVLALLNTTKISLILPLEYE